MAMLSGILKDVDLGFMVDMIGSGPGSFSSSWDSFDLYSMGQGINDQMFYDMAHDIMSQPIPLDSRLGELGSAASGGSVSVDDGAVTWSVPVPGNWGTEYYYSVTELGVIEGIRDIPPAPHFHGLVLV